MKTDIKKIASLAKLGLYEKDISRLEQEMSEIINFIDNPEKSNDNE